MKHVAWAIQGLALLLAGAAGAQGAKPLSKCALDAVASGTVCIDRYEASVWRVSDPGGFNAPLADKIRKGQVTLDELLAGARQLGTLGDYAPCTDGGQNCIGFTDPPQLLDRNIFAVSLARVVPAAHSAGSRRSRPARTRASGCRRARSGRRRPRAHHLLLSLILLINFFPD